MILNMEGKKVGGITPTGTKTINISSNGTTIEDVTNYANAQVVASVPNSYSAGDEGKVVSSGALVSQTTRNVTANGTYDTTTNNSTVVAVPASAVDTGTKNITANGNNQDVVGYAAVNVNVPNTYSAGDEGKVVSSGALVSQTSDTVTQNGTVDTTLINSLTVNVSGGGGGNIDAFLDGTITSVSSNVSSIVAYALHGRSAIETLSFPNLTMVPGNSLQDLSSLRSFYLPEVTQIGAVGMGYTGNAPISVWVFPKLESMLQQACRGSNSMTTFDMLGNSTSGIATNVFLNNALFTTLIIRGDVRVTGLGNIAAFGGTPFASGGSGGTLYVPNSLISTYQSASNWSTILGYANNQIKSIESTHTDPTAPIDLTLYYADGTAIS